MNVSEIVSEIISHLEPHAAADLLVVREGGQQPMSHKLLVPNYQNFRIGKELSTALEKCELLIGGNATNPPWDSVVTVHLRLEEDWLRYAKAKDKKDRGVFKLYYADLETIKSKFHESLDVFGFDSWPRSPVLVLLYGAGHLDIPLQQLRDGWPSGVRVVTSDELTVVLGHLDYLSQSIVSSRIASLSRHFIGNSFSSFSKIISASRRESGAPSHVYNSPGAGLTLDDGHI
jgi:hypothetical protein